MLDAKARRAAVLSLAAAGLAVACSKPAANPAPQAAAPAQAAPAQTAPAQVAPAPAAAAPAAAVIASETFSGDSDLRYLVEPAENKRYGFLTDSEGQRILDIFEGQFDVGAQKVQWAKFPEPPATSTKLTVTIPKVTPFEDVPLSR
jgi:hypothetical protein